ncbi:MAG: hypothetical protein B7Y32_02600, partial [Methylophilales bacterium 16-45-7]
MILPIAKKIQAILSHEKAKPEETILLQFQSLSASESLKLALHVIRELSADEKLPFNTYVKCLLKLDEGMQPHLEQVTAKRLKIKIYNRDLGMAMDVLVYPYYRHLFLEYMRVLTHIHKQHSKDIVDKDALVLLYCRTLNTAFSMMMWRYFDDQPAPAEAWLAIHDLFKHAEKSSLLNERTL